MPGHDNNSLSDEKEEQSTDDRKNEDQNAIKHDATIDKGIKNRLYFETLKGLMDLKIFLHEIQRMPDQLSWNDLKDIGQCQKNYPKNKVVFIL